MTRFLLIGASGLDWPGFSARLASGRLPHLDKLKRRGVAGWLTGTPPGERLASWASLATGEQPEIHGVFRDQEIWGGGLRPTGRSSWRVSPVWARLAEAGIRTASVGWPASRHGADWPGLHFDDAFAEASGADSWNWALPLRCCPAELRDAIRPRRVHPTDITVPMLLPLVPDLPVMDQKREVGLPALAVAMAKASTIQAAAVWLLSQSEAEAVFIHQPWLGEVRGKFENSRQGSFSHVMDGAWRFFDSLIGGLIAAAGPDVSVMLVSPGWQERPGVLLAAGGAITAATEPAGGSVLDVVPTLLGFHGLEDPALPGRRLAISQALKDYSQAPSASIAAPPPPDAALMRIAAENGGPPLPVVPPGWHAQGLAELALMLLNRAPESAAGLSEAALRHQPDNLLALAVRAMALVTLEMPDPLPELADALERAAPERGWGALARGAYHVLKGEIGKAGSCLTAAEADPDPETLLRVAGVWLAASRPVNAERVFKTILSRDPQNASAEIGLSMTAIARFDFLAAEAALVRARNLDPGRASVYAQLAQVYTATGRPLEAEAVAAIAERLGARPS